MVLVIVPRLVRAPGLLMAVQVELLPLLRDQGPTEITFSICCVEPATPSAAATWACSEVGMENDMFKAVKGRVVWVFVMTGAGIKSLR